MENEIKSSVIDVPRKIVNNVPEEDLFGIDKYQKALMKFIQLSETPLTIALQGEWGSGKTSLMNTLDFELCGNTGQFYRVWINSWQYSLMRTPEESIMKIVAGMIEQILNVSADSADKSDTVDKVKSIFRKIAPKVGKFIVKQVVDKAGGNTDFVDDLFGDGNAEGAEISNMKKIISEEINKKLLSAESMKCNKKGFIFFIDDLDRIDPPAAVQILELLKNIFDIDKCIFILAIDYDVVIKGLEPKFGKLTDKNEREFRSFFDKIIQLPFSMPVSSYDIDIFLIKALKTIGYIEQGEELDSDLIKDLSELANFSVGSNPRALKRLTNTLSLISLINKDDSKENVIENEKQLGFAMVCMQIAYPSIYNVLLEAPNFVEWNEKTAIKLKLDNLNEELLRLQNTTEFDEEWEKILFRICKKDSYTSNRVFHIARLLNKVKSFIRQDQDLGLVVESILEMSAVTNLMANDKQKTVKVSRKESLSIMKNFAREAMTAMKESGIAYKDETADIKSVADAVLFNIPIEIVNEKFKGFKFRVDFCQTRVDGCYMAIRAYTGEDYKTAMSAVFDNAWEKFTEKGIPKVRSEWSLSWKSYPINFAKLDGSICIMLNDKKQVSEFVSGIVSDIDKFGKILKEVLDADS